MASSLTTSSHHQQEHDGDDDKFVSGDGDARTEHKENEDANDVLVTEDHSHVIQSDHLDTKGGRAQQQAAAGASLLPHKKASSTRSTPTRRRLLFFFEKLLSLVLQIPRFRSLFEGFDGVALTHPYRRSWSNYLENLSCKINDESAALKGEWRNQQHEITHLKVQLQKSKRKKKNVYLNNKQLSFISQPFLTKKRSLQRMTERMSLQKRNKINNQKNTNEYSQNFLRPIQERLLESKQN